VARPELHPGAERNQQRIVEGFDQRTDLHVLQRRLERRLRRVAAGIKGPDDFRRHWQGQAQLQMTDTRTEGLNFQQLVQQAVELNE
jgi:hypothetical protein